MANVKSVKPAGTERIIIRISMHRPDWALICKVAKSEGMTYSAYVRRTALLAAQNDLAKILRANKRRKELLLVERKGTDVPDSDVASRGNVA